MVMITDATFLNSKLRTTKKTSCITNTIQPGICLSHNFKGNMPAGNTSSTGAITRELFVSAGMVSTKTKLFFSGFMLFVLCLLTVQAVLGTKEIN